MSDYNRRLEAAKKLADAGKLEEARAEFARLIAAAPREPGANAAMARTLSLLHKPAEAIPYSRTALRSMPGHPVLLRDLGTLLMETGEFEEAEGLLRQAALAEPESFQSRFNVVSVLLFRNRPHEAALMAREAMVLFPGNKELADKLAAALKHGGHPEEAVEMLRAAAAANPRDAGVALGLANALNYASGVPPRSALQAHVEAGRLLRAEVGAASASDATIRDPDPERPIRVGVLSPDLRDHSVAFFAEPIIAGLDRRRFPLVCFFSGGKPDDDMARLRRLAPAWRNATGLNDAELVRMIRNDRIDILIELSGLTRGERLRALLRRPAPIQITAIGYPNTTGLDCIDFRLVDSLTDPREPVGAAPAADELAVERLVRLDPGFLCYRPPRDAPDPAPPPSTGAGAGGGIAFGSFNALSKVSRRLISLWSRVVDAAPGSRLVLKNSSLDEPGQREDLASRFASEGIARERLDLLGHAPSRAGHLGAYARIDVALDTFPYCGTTTTCEALLMGVPVVTLAGDVHASRVGLSLLSGAGLPELVARDEDEYVRIAAGLARDRARLVELRTSLRSRLLASPLCDAGAYVARLQAALRAIWRERCAPGAAAGVGAGATAPR